MLWNSDFFMYHQYQNLLGMKITQFLDNLCVIKIPVTVPFLYYIRNEHVCISFFSTEFCIFLLLFKFLEMFWLTELACFLAAI